MKVVDEAADVDGMYHIFLLNVKANKWVFNGICAMTVNGKSKRLIKS